MDLQQAADELKNIHGSAVLVIEAWRDRDWYDLADKLNELQAELERIEEVE